MAKEEWTNINISPIVRTILDRWKKQSDDNSLRTITAAELISCTESDIVLLKTISEVTAKPFISRCLGSGISFCEAHSRQKINELLRYFYEDKKTKDV